MLSRLAVCILSALLAVALCGCGGRGGGGSLVIHPSSVDLSPGETQTFRIVSASSDLAAVDSLHLQWSCPAGTFSLKDGLAVEFTAGYAPGYWIVSASDGKLSGTASVTIR